METNSQTAIFVVALIAIGCQRDPRAQAESTQPQQHLHQLSGASPSDEQSGAEAETPPPADEVRRAETSEINSRYRAAVDIEARDQAFEARARLDVERTFRDAFIEDLRCSAKACFIDATFEDHHAWREFSPERLGWGSDAYLSPNEETLTFFALLGRGDNGIPLIDLAE